MKLIVGLGNYPEKYTRTRHNFGFLAVDYLQEKFSFSPFKRERKFFGYVSEGEINDAKCFLLKPETYMNLSGKAVASVARFYKIEPKDIWVWYDDIDLPFGKVRYREKGSAGGHNGIKSIISFLGTQEFPRLKFGISNEFRERLPTEAFVLQNFTESEWEKIPEIIHTGINKFQAQN